MPKLAKLIQIFSGANTTLANRWSAVTFFDKTLFAASGNVPLYYKSSSPTAQPIPGLPASTFYNGVSAFANHAILWTGSVLKWSDAADFSQWIPVGETAGALVLHLLNPFTQLAPNVETNYVYVKESTTGLTVGQFIRIITDPQFDSYEVTEVTPISGATVNTISVNQSITADGQNVYTTLYKAWVEDSHVGFTAEKKPMKVVSSSLNEDLQATTSAPFTQPAVSASVQITLTAIPDFTVGQYVSVNGSGPFVGGDIFKIIARDTVASKITIERQGVGSSQAITGATYASGSYVVSQPFITVNPVFASDAPIIIDNDGEISDMYGMKLKNVDFTGRSATNTVFPANREILTIDANEAGEVVNAGSNINGPISNFVPLGDFACIFKERSIQSMISVGRDAGTFAFRTEITDEGLFGRYCFKKIGESSIILLGQKELYIYKGGRDLTPVAKQYTRDLRSDIDASRADEIIFHHKEGRDEVWIVYFDKAGVQKVFIYNYVENSCTFDTYSDDFGNLTALGMVSWRNNLSWYDMTAPWDATLENWIFYVGEGEKSRIQMMAFQGRDPNALLNEISLPPLLVEQGENFTHDGDTYQSLAESPDFDFNDETAWKYVDTVWFSLQVKQTLSPRPFRLYMQVGARDALDADIRWSDPQYIEVSGNSNISSKINIRKSGRYIRIRFYSQQADIQWRISEYRIIARPGGGY